MRKIALTGLSLLLCTGCLPTNSSVEVSVQKAGFVNSVMNSVYPQDRSVFSDVYEPTDKPHDLVPKLPGQLGIDQQKPPLHNDN